MPSAFPFTETFLTNAVEKLKATILKEEFEHLEKLRSDIIKSYIDWAEKKLENVPDFLRRFTDVLMFPYVEKTRYGQAETKNQTVELREKKVPLVPGFVHNSYIGIISTDREVCLEYHRLKAKLDTIQTARYISKRKISYGEGLGFEEVVEDINKVKYDKPKYELTGLPQYREFFEKLIPEYEQDVRDSVHELITGKRPEIKAKPTTSGPIQLEFQF